MEGDLIYFPMLSKLISPHRQTLLPIAIRQHPTFKKLFPKVEQGIYLPGGIFSFRDSHGRDTLVSFRSDQLAIEQQRDDTWYRYVPEELLLNKSQEDCQSLIGSRTLVQHYTLWQSITQREGNQSQILAVDPATDRSHYLINARTVTATERARTATLKLEELKNNKNNSLEDLNKYYDMKLSLEQEISSAKPGVLLLELDQAIRLDDEARLAKGSKLLTAFESPQYIHEWYDRVGKLKEIELPRFKLSFSYDQATEKLRCKQFPDYTINFDATVAEMGAHHHFILLENGEGRRKLILPQQELKAPFMMEALEPRYKVDQEWAEISWRIRSTWSLRFTTRAADFSAKIGRQTSTWRRYWPQCRNTGRLPSILRDMARS